MDTGREVARQKYPGVVRKKRCTFREKQEHSGQFRRVGALAGKVRELTEPSVPVCITTCISSLPAYTFLGFSNVIGLGTFCKEPKHLGHWLL